MAAVLLQGHWGQWTSIRGERGLQALTAFLKKSQKLTPLAMRKLWKGIFYCFWHSGQSTRSGGPPPVLEKQIIRQDLLSQARDLEAI